MPMSFFALKCVYILHAPALASPLKMRLDESRSVRMDRAIRVIGAKVRRRVGEQLLRYAASRRQLVHMIVVGRRVDMLSDTARRRPYTFATTTTRPRRRLDDHLAHNLRRVGRIGHGTRVAQHIHARCRIRQCCIRCCALLLSGGVGEELAVATACERLPRCHADGCGSGRGRAASATA